MSGPIKQHLALFLDGTWNTEDDSTNILNAYNLTLDEDATGDTILQKRYYDRGVGTGMLDSFTGGGLGLGLEINVREAYNWLVDHYNDGDEIYIFGFSRGAYTARSLVSLIATCGLVERGAPLTVSQLWAGYAFISRNRSRPKDWWQKIVEVRDNTFRRIDKLKPNERNSNLDRVVEKKNQTHTEKLVARWCRRVKITYLGIFDTVGALGLDALGIPGLSGRLSGQHNQNPSGIIHRCRHALAIDEHRSSFRLTPILDYVRHDAKEGEAENYKGKIEHRWFVGAHSNVGGGYADNPLATRPLQWVLEGAAEVGLMTMPLPMFSPAEASARKAQEEAFASPDWILLLREKALDNIPELSPAKIAQKRDSYSEFASPLWVHLLREKRYYRPVGRADNVRADYSLRPIDERIDESVLEMAKKDPTYAPPNLVQYAHSLPTADGGDQQAQYIASVRQLFVNPERTPVHDWSACSPGAAVTLVFWCIFAALGLQKIPALFSGEPFAFSMTGLAIIASLYALIDWAESRCNLEVALHPASVRKRVLWNLLYWIRLIGVIAFFFGAIGLGIDAWYAEWSLANVWDLVVAWYPLLLAPLLTTGILYFLTANEKVAAPQAKPRENKLTDPIEYPGRTYGEEKASVPSALSGYLSKIAMAVFLVALLRHLAFGMPEEVDADAERLAGELLLLLLLLVVSWGVLLWIGKPMDGAMNDLGSSARLQCCFSWAQIRRLFEGWQLKLARNWVGAGDRRQLAWDRLREGLRESLWRDLVGFIPAYSLLLGTALYLGSFMKKDYFENNAIFKNITFFDCLSDPVPVLGLQTWLVLILTAALADVLENTVHLRHVDNYSRKESSSGLLVGLGALATIVKFAAIVPAALLSAAVLLIKIVELFLHSGGWRWFVAVGIIYVFLLLIAQLIIRKGPWGSTSKGKDD